MLPLRLFRIRNFVGANVLTLLLYAALGGGLFFFPLNLVQVQGYSASAAGAALLPFILIMFVLSRWAGALVDRIGSKRPLMLGPTIAAAGFALFALPGLDADFWTGFFPAVIVLGLGMSVTVAPLTTTVMNSVGVDLSGVASGINNAVARAAALLAIAIFGMVMAQVFEVNLQQRLDRANVPAEARAFLHDQGTKLAATPLPSGLDASVAATVRHAVEASFVAGFRWIMILCAFLALSSALAAWLSIRDDPPSAERQRARKAPAVRSALETTPKG